MKKKINIFSITSLVISLVAFGMYCFLLKGDMGFLYIPWLITGTISIFFPIMAKYFRKTSGKAGKSFEIASIVVGFINLYWVLAIATKWNLIAIYLLCILACVIYGISFNKTQVKEKTEKNRKKSLLSASVIFSLLACLCALFIFIEALIYDEFIEDVYLWLIIFLAYVIIFVLFLVNEQKKSPIISIISFCITTFFSVAMISAICEEAGDFSGEASIASWILMLLSFASLVFSVIALFKAKWNFAVYHNSIRYKEKCYKRVEKMKRYLDEGIITQEEYEKNKNEILKHIQ